MGSEVWRLVHLQACGRRSGQAPGQPSPTSSSRTGATNTLHKPPPLELNRWTGTGIWRLRPRRTYRVGTRAWPPASAPSPPAGPNCWGTPGASPLGGPGWAQAIHPGACRTLPPPLPEALVRVAVLRDCPPRPSYVGSTRLDSQRRLQMGTFCLNCFLWLPASCLLERKCLQGRDAPLRGTCARPRTGPSAQHRESTDSHHVNQLREPSSSSWAGRSQNLPEV